jgi:hypothetical protein
MAIPIQGGFADVEAASFEALPRGRYHVTVFEGEVKQSGPNAKHPGADYLAWTLKVQEGKYSNRNVWYNTSLTEEARGLLKAFLQCFYEEDELNNPDFELDINDVVGRECIAVVRVGTNPNTGEANNNVSRCEAYDPEAFELAEDDEELPV